MTPRICSECYKPLPPNRPKACTPKCARDRAVRLRRLIRLVPRPLPKLRKYRIVRGFHL